MDEILVAVWRTVACMARLRILSCLAHEREIAPTALADQLRMAIDVVCTHLRRLSAAGLIQRRRSGAKCYCMARSPYSEKAFSGKVACWLFESLKDPGSLLKGCDLGQSYELSRTDPQSLLHRLVFEAATAFANVRRLQILRRLVRGGLVAAGDLAVELKMSESAVSRHAGKLVRRGYLKAVPAGRQLSYRLARQFKTPVHRQLFDFVRAEWRKE